MLGQVCRACLVSLWIVPLPSSLHWQSIVLHKMALRSQQSTYPIALGVRISGVDDATFSQTGGLSTL